ncbi:hypothetical protein ABGB09_34060 [Streptomyces sp. B8F3]|uniref:hypothetical protein n=1 Tax=Streptomyces sp. B8F3 TaxID=3153573 RepID=UPI00325EF782
MSETDLVAAMPPELGRLNTLVESMKWAEDEIEKAQTRHHEQGPGPIWHSFKLLKPTHELLLREALYRSHCHEILERVARNEDTRPGTDAEMIVILHETSLAAPMKSGAVCLYFRLLDRSVPELARVTHPAIDLAAYEEVHGRVADNYEADLRQRLRQSTRKA